MSFQSTSLRRLLQRCFLALPEPHLLLNLRFSCPISAHVGTELEYLICTLSLTRANLTFVPPTSKQKLIDIPIILLFFARMLSGPTQIRTMQIVHIFIYYNPSSTAITICILIFCSHTTSFRKCIFRIIT